MPTSGEAIAAVSTDNVAFASDEVALGEALHTCADALDDADILVADDHRYWDRFLRPGVPIVDMDVSPADRRLLDSDEHIIVTDCGHRHFFQPEAWLGLLFHERAHRLLHGRRLGESGSQENRKVDA